MLLYFQSDFIPPNIFSCLDISRCGRKLGCLLISSPHTRMSSFSQESERYRYENIIPNINDIKRLCVYDNLTHSLSDHYGERLHKPTRIGHPNINTWQSRINSLRLKLIINQKIARTSRATLVIIPVGLSFINFGRMLADSPMLCCLPQ